MPNPRTLLFALLALLPFAASADPLADERAALLKGVTAVAAPGSPGAVCVFGEQAYVLIDGPSGARKSGARIAVAGVGHLGKGRVVAFGHDGFLKPAALKIADTAALFDNLARVAAGRDKPVYAVVRNKPLADALKARGLDAASLDAGAVWRDAIALGQIDAIFFPPGVPADDADAALIRTYVKAGGTAVFGVTGWAQELPKGESAIGAALPVNRLLGDAGLVITAAFSGNDGGAGDAKTITVSKDAPAMLHAGAAIDRLARSAAAAAPPQGAKPKADPELAAASATALLACDALPPTAAPIARLRTLIAAPTLAVPTFKRPLGAADALPRIALVLSVRDSLGLPADQVKAHPAAAEFPGPVPADAPRVERTIKVDTATPRWHSTGLYAAPGEVVTATVPASAARRGLKLRIGAHTDKTYHLPAWRRAPEIAAAFPIEAQTRKAASAFGGLIYIEVPADSSLGTIDVTIANAVEAPLFILGQTDLKAWRDSIRTRPAPWAEVGTGKLIITLRADAIRTLDDPTAVLQHWDKVMDASATLAGWPLARKSPERMVADVDISAGYMHSGYPIMTGLDVNATFVDLPKLRTVDGGWGFYHEIGHNHQSPDWTFDGTTEVTVNLFTMHSLETVCGATVEESTRRAIGPRMQPKIKAYLAQPDFEKWKADPFLALAMYAQLRADFGWEPFKKSIAEYRALPPGQHPRTETDKHDQWMTRMSHNTGKNLAPFFEAWAIPTSEKARAALADLPKWMPAEK